jgi:hypothetical protein
MKDLADILHIHYIIYNQYEYCTFLYTPPTGGPPTQGFDVVPRTLNAENQHMSSHEK